jgi:hypothetical protein
MMPSPMDAVKGVKEIAEIIKKYNDLPLYEKIVNLHSEVVDQASEIIRLRNENSNLQAALDLKAKTRYAHPYYYEEGDEIPLCPKCFVNSGGTKRAHMSHPSSDFINGHGRKCMVCDDIVKEGPRKTPRPDINRSPRSSWG